MRRLTALLLACSACVIGVGVGYWLGWQQRGNAEVASLKSSTCFAKLHDGRATIWMYVGDERCREISEITGPPDLMIFDQTNGSSPQRD
jgi:uncharacterized membrane protein